MIIDMVNNDGQYHPKESKVNVVKLAMEYPPRFLLTFEVVMPITLLAYMVLVTTKLACRDNQPNMEGLW